MGVAATGAGTVVGEGDVVGVVSTNAMGYDSNAPAFKDGFLNYRVTGLHFQSDGLTPNLGTYDLVLRSDAARCLYGFSDAPISATVEIAGADGTQNVATTVVSEKELLLEFENKIEQEIYHTYPFIINECFLYSCRRFSYGIVMDTKKYKTRV